jgi:hypothetical protein
MLLAWRPDRRWSSQQQLDCLVSQQQMPSLQQVLLGRET